MDIENTYSIKVQTNHPEIVNIGFKQFSFRMYIIPKLIIVSLIVQFIRFYYNRMPISICETLYM